MFLKYEVIIYAVYIWNYKLYKRCPNKIVRSQEGKRDEQMRNRWVLSRSAVATLSVVNGLQCSSIVPISKVSAVSNHPRTPTARGCPLVPRHALHFQNRFTLFTVSTSTWRPLVLSCFARRLSVAGRLSHQSLRQLHMPLLADWRRVCRVSLSIDLVVNRR